MSPTGAVGEHRRGAGEGRRNAGLSDEEGERQCDRPTPKVNRDKRIIGSYNRAKPAEFATRYLGGRLDLPVPR